MISDTGGREKDGGNGEGDLNAGQATLPNLDLLLAMDYRGRFVLRNKSSN
jgi:hypothetical protein